MLMGAVPFAIIRVFQTQPLKLLCTLRHLGAGLGTGGLATTLIWAILVALLVHCLITLPLLHCLLQISHRLLNVILFLLNGGRLPFKAFSNLCSFLTKVVQRPAEVL